MVEYRDFSRVGVEAINVLNGEDVEAEVANRPHDQSFVNSDWLASTLNADRNLVIRGGGSLTWDHGTAQLHISERLYIEAPNERLSGSGGVTRTILNQGTLSFGTHRLAALRINRAQLVTRSVSEVVFFPSFEAFRNALEGLSSSTQRGRFEYLLLAARNLTGSENLSTDLILWDGRRIRSGFQLIHQGSTDTQYAQQASVSSLETTVNQNLNLRILGGGNLTWDAGGLNRLSLGEDLVVVLPTNIRMTIAAGDLSSISDWQAYYIPLTREDSTWVSGNVLVANLSSLPKSSSVTFILAVRYGGKLYLADGTVFEAGQVRPLGGPGTGVKWRFTGIGNGLSALNFATASGTLLPAGTVPSYQVGGGELLVWVNGVLQTEGIDYLEVGVSGTLSTSITWISSAGPPPQDPPDASDVLSAMVGLANPNRGPVGPEGGTRFDPAEYDGTSLTGGNPPEGEVQIRMDADESIEILSGPSYLTLSAGDFLRAPLFGSLTGAGTEGALRAIPQLPTVSWTGDPLTDTGVFYLSPGELPVPLSAARSEFRTARIFRVLKVPLITADSLGFWTGITYPAPIYVYVAPAFPTHGSDVHVRISKHPPVALVDSSDAHLTWLASPVDAAYTFVGSFIGGGVDGEAPSSLVPFTRSGEVVHLGDPAPSFELVGGGGGGAIAEDNYSLSSIEAALPHTALSVFLQVHVAADLAANSLLGSGFMLGAGPSSGPAMPSSFTKDPTSNYVTWMPSMANPTGGTVSLTQISPVFEIPIWAPGGVDPEVGMTLGPDFESVTVVYRGYRESLIFPYRLGIE
jgi:hypothetical protein